MKIFKIIPHKEVLIFIHTHQIIELSPQQVFQSPIDNYRVFRLPSVNGYLVIVVLFGRSRPVAFSFHFWIRQTLWIPDTKHVSTTNSMLLLRILQSLFECIHSRPRWILDDDMKQFMRLYWNCTECGRNEIDSSSCSRRVHCSCDEHTLLLGFPYRYEVWRLNNKMIVKMSFILKLVLTWVMFHFQQLFWFISLTNWNCVAFCELITFVNR